MDLTKLQNDVLGQMVLSEPIVNSFTPSLKNSLLKATLPALVAAITFFSSGMAHAGGNNYKPTAVATGLSVVTGILVDGSRPADIPADCTVQGTNGYKVGGAGAAGSVAGGQIGEGKGNYAAALGIGFVAATATQSSEDNRIRRECEAQRIQRQQDYERSVNNGYNNNLGTQYNNYNNGYNRAPSYPQRDIYVPTSVAPTPQINAPILYATRDNNGSMRYSTMDNSVGMSYLRQGILPTDNGIRDPMVMNAISQASQDFLLSYNSLSVVDRNLLTTLQDKNSVEKQNKYAVSYEQRNAAEINTNQYRGVLQQKLLSWQDAQKQYMNKRAEFFRVMDNAVSEGYYIPLSPEQLNRLANSATAPLEDQRIDTLMFGKPLNKYPTLSNR